MYPGTKNGVKTWLETAIKRGATHVIITHDTDAAEAFPVEVKKGIKLQTVLDELTKEGGHDIQEIYNLTLDLEDQLAQTRAYNLDEVEDPIDSIQDTEETEDGERAESLTEA